MLHKTIYYLLKMTHGGLIFQTIPKMFRCILIWPSKLQ